MFAKKPKAPPSHFRRHYAKKKAAWLKIEEQLSFRPKVENFSLWCEIVERNVSSALFTATSLMAVQLFERLIKEQPRGQIDLDEEVVIHECLIFSCFLLPFHLEDYLVFLEDLVESPPVLESYADKMTTHFEQMSLLDYDDLEEAEMERFPRYQECNEIHRWRDCMSRTFARVMTRVAAGEHFTKISFRAEDPVDLTYEMAVTAFLSDLHEHLNRIGALVEKYVRERELACMTMRG